MTSRRSRDGTTCWYTRRRPWSATWRSRGPFRTLWAATSAADTDFTAKLVDVCEHGCARNLTDGIIRARYRNSKSTPSLVEPGRAYCYTIDLWATRLCTKSASCTNSRQFAPKVSQKL